MVINFSGISGNKLYVRGLGGTDGQIPRESSRALLHMPLIPHKRSGFEASSTWLDVIILSTVARHWGKGLRDCVLSNTAAVACTSCLQTLTNSAVTYTSCAVYHIMCYRPEASSWCGNLISEYYLNGFHTSQCWSGNGWAHGRAVGWVKMCKVAGSFPCNIINVFNISLPVTLGTDSASNTHESQESPLRWRATDAQGQHPHWHLWTDFLENVGA